MLWLKGCTKCHGDLHQDRDMYGTFVACLNCGYYLTDQQAARLLVAQPPLKARAALKPRKEPLPIGR